MSNLHASIPNLSPLAVKTAPTLKKLGIETVRDLLYYFPIRYQDLRALTKLTDAARRPGEVLTVKATLDEIKDIRTRSARRLITEGMISDNTGSAKVVWFNQRFLSRTLRAGDELLLTGKWERTSKGVIGMHPEHEKVKTAETQMHTGRIVPFYPLTQGLTQKLIRFLVTRALLFLSTMNDYLPETIRGRFSLLPLKTALRSIHFPSDDMSRLQAEHRLKFDELFMLQLANWKRKQELNRAIAPPLPFSKEETKTYVDTLPFKLTEAQRKAAWDILKDLGKNRPMNRLLEGDVGSGKTVVASIAILNTICAGYQVAYMAPTEILAEQHFATFQRLFQNQNLSIALLTGSQTRKAKGHAILELNRLSPDQQVIGASSARKKLHAAEPDAISAKQLVEEIAQQKIEFVIGTHSLIQDRVSFPKLGLVIVDEQHRFGVKQRAQLMKQRTEDRERGSKKEKDDSLVQSPKSKVQSLVPHFLSMTATPIPRTLALTAYGDLDISILDEVPSNRKKIKTMFVPDEKRAELYQRIADEIKNSRQVFVVCPIIDPSDALGVAAVSEKAELLKTRVFPQFSIGVLHGRMNAQQKTNVMRAFLNREHHILIATPVIEVGIDVPNATVMVIENAERFGLAQLHQIRGRVGRGEHQSYCFLLSSSDSADSRERLRAFLTAENGFALAEKDLEIRGPGTVFGTVQSGFEDSLYIAKLTDYPVIREAQEAVQLITQLDPTLSKNRVLLDRINEWEMTIHRE